MKITIKTIRVTVEKMSVISLLILSIWYLIQKHRRTKNNAEIDIKQR